jgi:hypothetical protein
VFFTGTFQAFPAMSRNGEATIAWLGNVLDPAFDAQITAITRSPSGTWGPYEQVSNQDGGDTYADAYDGQGNTYALWSHDRAYAAFRPAGQRFSGAETPLSEQAADGAGPVDATIAASPIDTGAIAAWEFGRSPEEPKNRVEASVFTNPPGQTQPGDGPTNTGGGTAGSPSSSDGSSPSATNPNSAPGTPRRPERCIKAIRAVRRASLIRHRWAVRYRHHRTHRNRRKLRAARTRLLHALHTRHGACASTH